MEASTAIAPQARSGKRLAKTLRRQRLLRAVVGGSTVAQAAEAEGIDASSAARIIRQALEELSRQNDALAEHVRDIELRRLDAMHEKLWPKIDVPEPYVECQGCGETAGHASVIEHGSGCGNLHFDDDNPPPGYKLVRPQPPIKIHQQLLKISERRSKLIGLDAPQKIDAKLTVNAGDELVDREELERQQRIWDRRDETITLPPSHVEEEK